MKQLHFIILLWLFSATVYSQEITGKWLTEDGKAVVLIAKAGKEINGKIIWLREPEDKAGKPVTDKENPDKSRWNTPILGLMVLKKLENKNGKWENGSIYDPKDGKTYTCSIWVENGKLKVRGYIGIFYRTETWTRM